MTHIEALQLALAALPIEQRIQIADAIDASILAESTATGVVPIEGFSHEERTVLASRADTPHSQYSPWDAVRNIVLAQLAPPK